MHAVVNGKKEFIEVLGKVGADVNKRYITGETVMIKSMNSYYFSMDLHKLIKWGADVSAIDNYHVHDLMKAADKHLWMWHNMKKLMLIVGTQANNIRKRWFQNIQ